MDLGVEVRPEVTSRPGGDHRRRGDAGHLHVSTAQRAARRRTRSRIAPNRIGSSSSSITPATGSWRDSEKPAESTRQTHRFEWKVAAGKIERKTVTETPAQSRHERPQGAGSCAASRPAAAIDQAAKSPKASAALKAALDKLLAARSEAARAADGDQEWPTTSCGRCCRIRSGWCRPSRNCRRGRRAHKRVLARYDEQEAQVEKLQKLLAEKRSAEQKEQAEFTTQWRSTLTVK